MTQAGIEPAIFRFVAQHLNHCAKAVTLKKYVLKGILNNNDALTQTRDPRYV